jgi:hypothetical protein
MMITTFCRDKATNFELLTKAILKHWKTDNYNKNILQIEDCPLQTIFISYLL